MITKKRLLKELNRLGNDFVMFRENVQAEIVSLKQKVSVLESEKEKDADLITGAEAARLLGWQSGYVSATWLGKVGINYTKGDNGCLKISRKDIEDYLTTRAKTNED